MIKNVFQTLTSVFLLAAVLLAPANAQLVLTIDADNETYELSGSDSGNVEWSDNFAQVFWTVDDPGTDGSTFLTQQAPALNVTGWTPTDNAVVTIEFIGDSQFAVLLAQDTKTDINGLPITVTALGGTVNYSGHSNAFKTAFENLIGSTIPLANGSNFSDITVQGPNTVVLGDANDDGEFNNLDIAAFVLALTDIVTYQAMFPNVDPEVVLDMNDDGKFNNLDIADFVAALTGP